MTLFVRMTDKFLSGWGQAEGKTNVLVVVCDSQDQANQIEFAARGRSEMEKIATLDQFPPPKDGILYTCRHYNELTGSWKS